MSYLKYEVYIKCLLYYLFILYLKVEMSKRKAATDFLTLPVHKKRLLLTDPFSVHTNSFSYLTSLAYIIYTSNKLVPTSTELHFALTVHKWGNKAEIHFPANQNIHLENHATPEYYITISEEESVAKHDSVRVCMCVGSTITYIGQIFSERLKKVLITVGYQPVPLALTSCFCVWSFTKR